jgi:hypothetical protein
MTGERVFCSHLKGKVPTNPNLPTTGESYCPAFFPRQLKEHIASIFLNQWKLVKKGTPNPR